MAKFGEGVLWAAAAMLLMYPSARAQDRFEIQVYDSQTAPPLGVGLEVHTNFDARGTKESSDEGELPTERVSHFTLEPHLGLTPWLEVGAYFQTALRPEGRFDFAGLKLRVKARLRERIGGLVGLAVNAEISDIPRAYEPNRYGSELRPIADLRSGRFYASLNPIIAIDLGGSLAGHPQLQPATKASIEMVAGLAIGLEQYSGFGPIDGLLPAAQQRHFLFAALDWTGRLFDLNAGVGRGFGQAEPWVAKAILGIHWDPAPEKGAPENPLAHP